MSLSPVTLSSRNRTLAVGIVLALLLVLPTFVYPVLLMKLLCFALFACAFNLLLGFGGLLSFGHAAFFGSAAYVTAHMLKVWGWPTVLGLAGGTLAAALLGAVLGYIAIRRQGIYFAMITLALSQMVYFVFIQAPFTGGEDGLQDVPRGSVFGLSLSDDFTLYYFVLAVTIGGLWLVYRTVHSPFGQVLQAIRDNEPRAISLGYDADRYKWLAFILSAGLSGLAGSTKVLVFRFATLTDAHWTSSGEVVLMALLGGFHSVFGPAVGAIIIVLLQSELADKAGSLVTVIIGFIFVICVLFFRDGIVGSAEGLWRKMRGGRDNH